MSALHPERPEADVLAGSWIAAFNGEGTFAACCSAQVQYEDPLSGRPLLGTVELEAHAARLFQAFPDAHVRSTAPALMRDGHACVPWQLEGTNTGDVSVLPATDRRLSLHGLHYLELRDGRVLRARGFFDLYDGAVQLGVLPARGGLGEAAMMLLRGFGLRL